tara:strand:- start:12743 stop:14179 length:1437 start_codon:yes stop_codon:yes gene_type:complete
VSYICVERQPILTKYLLYILLSVCILSCNNKDKNGVTTYLGGQIINPKMDYVLLSHPDKRNDTIALNANGSFDFQCENLQTNLYIIRHNELQYIFIEPGDSIMFHLNTVDFDESLAFSGRGAEKNNFLMNLFLSNEEEDKKLPELYKLNPQAFEEEIAHSKKALFIELDEFIVSENPSETFISIASANINYNYYSRKELYLSTKNSFAENKDLIFPEGFFTYRDSIELNNNILKNYYTYYQFLNRYLDNLAHDAYKQESDLFIKASFRHQEQKLKLIDQWITNTQLHDNLLHTNVKRYLAHADDTQKEQDLVRLFKKLDHNKTHQKDVEIYAQNTAKINAGNMIPGVLLVTANKKLISLQKINTSKSVFFFWNRESVKHYKEIHVRVAELKSKYPEYNFIGINTGSDYLAWKETVISSGYNQAHEYQLENSTTAKNALFINSANKAMIVDVGGIILEGNSNLFNQNFESLLLGHLNKK